MVSDYGRTAVSLFPDAACAHGALRGRLEFDSRRSGAAIVLSSKQGVVGAVTSRLARLLRPAWECELGDPYRTR